MFQSNKSHQSIHYFYSPRITYIKLSDANLEYREYELRMLAPSEDFALDHWKKTTFHMINYAPQHKSKVAVWNAINSYVHSKSIQVRIRTKNTFTLK